jgi:hypothetical protein
MGRGVAGEGKEPGRNLSGRSDGASVFLLGQRVDGGSNSEHGFLS